MRLLVLVNIVPYPTRGGVQLRVYNLLRRVAEHHEVTLGCHAWDEDDVEAAAWLTRNGMRTVTAPLKAATWRQAGAATRMLLAGRPPELFQFQAPALHALVARERFDILQIEETLLTPYAASLPPGAATKTLLVFHNIHFVQEPRIAAIDRDPLQRRWRRLNGQMMRRYEPAVAARFDAVTTVTCKDRATLLARDPSLAIDVLPNGVDTAALQPLPPPSLAKQAIIFVGTMGYPPCIDAVQWLVGSVLPILRRSFPDLDLWIVGRRPPPEVQALADVGVFVAGDVPDVAPFYLRAAVAVVPLRAGGGSRLKILEAMALGRPVVSTTVGAEGLEVTPGHDILLADDAASFAAAVAEVLTDRGRWQALASNGRRFVEEKHDWDRLARQQLAIYDRMLSPPAPPE